MCRDAAMPSAGGYIHEYSTTTVAIAAVGICEFTYMLQAVFAGTTLVVYSSHTLSSLAHGSAMAYHLGVECNAECVW